MSESDSDSKSLYVFVWTSFGSSYEIPNTINKSYYMKSYKTNRNEANRKKIPEIKFVQRLEMDSSYCYAEN